MKKNDNRKKKNRGKKYQLPDWMKQELADAGPPDAGIVKQYEYLNKDIDAFIDTLCQASEQIEEVRPEVVQSCGGTGVDVIFSLTGRVLQWTCTQVALLTPYQGQYACASATRGIDEKKTAVQGVASKDRNTSVEISTVKSSHGIDVQVNVYEKVSGMEIRPFTVSVTDPAGEVLVEPMRIGMGAQAPLFPGPSAGVYIFSLAWQGGEKKITAVFQ